MLKLRIITGLILLPIALICILWLPSIAFKLVVAVALLLACWEWAGLIPLQSQLTRAVYVVMVTVFTLISITFLPLLFFIVVAAWLWGCAVVFVYARGKKPLGLQYPLVKMLLGAVVFAGCYHAILLLRDIDLVTRTPWLLMALFIVVAADVGAFFSGKMWGKKLLAPRVSPKKTWAGFFGGVLFAMLISFIFTALTYYFEQMPLRAFFQINMASFVAVVFSVMGDLVESILKREANIKDSGSLLPGHGGLLDRLDSILPAIPFFLLIGFSHF